MKKRTGILGVLIAILALGIGYAAISAVTLTINGSGKITPNANNFKVHYTGDVATSDNTFTTDATHDNDKTGTFSVSGMTKKGDTVTFTYTIVNDSDDITATLGTPTITNDNTTYFTVTSETAATTLAPGATTTQTVTIEAIKTPVDADQEATVEVQLSATPNE